MKMNSTVYVGIFIFISKNLPKTDYLDLKEIFVGLCPALALLTNEPPCCSPD
jgi:hypothetical protein